MDPVLIGWLYIVQILYLVPYIPCSIVIFQKDLISKSAFKLMGFMGVLDGLLLVIGSLVLGTFSILDLKMGENPMLMKVVGGIANGFWWMYCISNLVLAFNRVIDLRSSEWEAKLFEGKKTLLWIGGCVVVGVIIISLNMTQFSGLSYNPTIGVLVFDGNGETYGLPINRTFNWIIVTTLLMLYIIMWIVFRWRVGGVSTDNINSKERRLVLQVFVVSFAVFLTATLYVYLPYNPNIPVHLLPMINFMWLFTQGCNPLIYLTLNQTIRGRVLKLLRLKSSSVGPVHCNKDGRRMTNAFQRSASAVQRF